MKMKINMRRTYRDLDQAYERFVRRHGRINDAVNARAFDEDSSYYM